MDLTCPLVFSGAFEEGLGGFLEAREFGLEDLPSPNWHAVDACFISGTRIIGKVEAKRCGRAGGLAAVGRGE